MSVIIMCKNFLYNEVFTNNSKIYIPNNIDSLFLIVILYFTQTKCQYLLVGSYQHEE